MIKINLLTVGKLKEKYWRDACSEYSKRLSAFCKLEIVELAESRLSDNPSEKEILSALNNEAKGFKPYIDKKSSVNIAMCIEGKQMTSEQFSQKISTLAVDGVSNLVFVLGSSFGLADELKKQSDFRFSMSEMTFPHQMARVMLLEQLYRAFQIANGGQYHK